MIQDPHGPLVLHDARLGNARGVVDEERSRGVVFGPRGRMRSKEDIWVSR